MALSDLLAQLNIVNCAAGNVVGTGLAGCKTDMKRILAILLIERGYKFTDAINKSLIQTLQQQGKIIWLGGLKTFTDSTPENAIDTAPGSGNKSLLTEFPYEYTGVFDNGISFQEALSYVSGNGNFDLALLDVDDQLWLTKNKAGDVKGFALGMHQKGKYTGANGEVRAAQSFFMQLTDRNEVDKRATWVTPSDFSATDMDGVNDVTITIDEISVAASATTIVFTPLLKDGTHLLEGLTLANIRTKKNGVVVTPTGTANYATNSGKVTLTVAAMTAGQVITVELWDTTLGVPIILPSTGVLYKSAHGADAASTTVVA